LTPVPQATVRDYVELVGSGSGADVADGSGSVDVDFGARLGSAGSPFVAGKPDDVPAGPVVGDGVVCEALDSAGAARIFATGNAVAALPVAVTCAVVV
jgi:hypothetical protein